MKYWKEAIVCAAATVSMTVLALVAAGIVTKAVTGLLGQPFSWSTALILWAALVCAVTVLAFRALR